MLHKFLVAFCLAVIVGTGALVGFAAIAMYPTQLTGRNVYSFYAYKLLGRVSEHDQQWYVKDLIAQVAKPYTPTEKTGVWEGQTVAATLPMSEPSLEARVLPASIGGDEKWIDVDLTNQVLYAKEGTNVVFTAKISSGKAWTPTPTGEFRIWLKVPSQTMKGGSKETGDYYYLPNVTYVMYFYKGYGLHTAYWHNNFGHPMSHGCLNMRAEDAKWLYAWTGPVVPEGSGSLRSTDDNPGTRVVIHT